MENLYPASSSIIDFNPQLKKKSIQEEKKRKKQRNRPPRSPFYSNPPVNFVVPDTAIYTTLQNPKPTGPND